MRRSMGLATFALIAVTACASFGQPSESPDDPLTILVLDAPSLDAFTIEARSRPNAPVQYFSANFDFFADADPAWCAFLSDWRARNPAGRSAADRKSMKAFAAAREASGVAAPNVTSFRSAPDETVPLFSAEALERWTFVLPNKSNITIAPKESASFIGASVRGYSRVALTSAEGRSVDFRAAKPISFVRSQAHITLVGPFRVIIEEDAVHLQLATGEEEIIRAEAARVTGRTIEDVEFAVLGKDTAERCLQ